MKYSELSKAFNDIWKLKEDDLKEKEFKFMEAVNDIIYWSTNDSEDKSIRENSYDLPYLLDGIKKVIEDYNDLYHMIYITSTYADSAIKDKEVKGGLNDK